MSRAKRVRKSKPKSLSKKAEDEVRAMSRFPAENPNPVMRISKDGVILYCNDAGLPILNEWKCQVGQPVPRSWCQLVADVFTSSTKKEFEEEYAARIFSFIFAPIAEGGYVNVYGLDVTERKKAEEALKQSEEKYRSLFANMMDGYAFHRTIFDDKGKPVDYVFLEINEAFERLTGLSRAKVIGKRATEVLPGIENDPADWLGTYGKAVTTRQPIKFENYAIPLQKWYSVSAYGLEEDYLVVTFEDITERKKTEERLSQQALMLASANDAIIGYDLESQITFWNKGAQRLYGYSAEEVLGKRSYEVLTPTYSGVSREELINRVMSAGHLEVESIRSTRDGRKLNIDTHVILLRDEKGKPVGYLAIDRDITERKQAEEALRKAREELEIRVQERTKDLREASEKLHASSQYTRSLIEASLDPLVTISAEGRITDVNKSTEEVTGFSRDQLIGKDFSDYFTEPEKAKEGYGKVFTEGFVRDFPLAIRHKSGKITDVLYNATIYKNDKGEIEGVFAAARDVTKSKLAEEKVRAASLYSRSLIEASLDPLVTISADGKITDVNKSTEDVTGVPREQLIGSDFSDYFVDSEEARKGYMQVFTQGFVRDYPLTIRHKSGKITDVLYNATVYRNEAGEIQGVFAAARDVTERKKAQEELRRAHDELETRVQDRTRELNEAAWKLQAEITERKEAEQALRDSERDLNRAQAVAKTGSWRLDLRRNELLWSDETYHIFGIPRGTPMTYEAFLAAVHPDDRAYVDQTWKAALQGEPYDIEHRIIVNGEVKWVRERAELEVEPGNDALLGGFGTVQDITGIKEMQAKLEEYSQHLEQLVEEKTQKLKEVERLATIGETAGMVGHDIRNPLQSIEGAVYLAKEELKTIPAEIQERKELEEILEIIQNQTNYIDHIVAELQDFARTPMPQPREVNIQELVTDSLSMIEIPEKIEVQTAFQEDLSKLAADPVFMKRVIVNLIENAVQAMPNGGKLTLRVFRDEESTHICVEDTGVGISEEHKAKIFSPLFTTKAKGQGFGLSVCKKLVAAHNGEITFESRPGNTTFKIRLPLKKSAN